MAQLTLEQRIQEFRKRQEEEFPGPYQPRIPTMERKVAIEVAMPGWQPKGWYEEKGVHNLPPFTFEDQANCIVECVKAGAAIVHSHPRDPDTGLTAPRERHKEYLEEIMDRAHGKVDFITAHHTLTSREVSGRRYADYVSETSELLEDGQKKGIGNFYVQLGMILTMPVYTYDRSPQTVEAIQEGTKWYEANNVKPMFSCESFAIQRLKRHLFDNGIAKSKPYWLAIQEGKHEEDRIFADPWCALEVITDFGLAKSALGDNAMVGIHPAGRNWLTAANIALLCGAEFVRVGIEDIFYLYPHRDDISRNASDTTKIMVNLIQTLGREVATVEDVRKRAGIKLTK